MSRVFLASETLELLEKLRGTIREFAGREEELRSEFDVRLGQLERGNEKHRTEAETAARNELAAAQQQFEAERDRLQERHANRARRLADAHASSRRTTLERIDTDEGRRKYGVQKGTLDAERSRTDSLKANDASLANFQKELAGIREQFITHEKTAGVAFRGFRNYQRLLLQDQPVTVPADRTEGQIQQDLRALQAQTEADLQKFRGLILPRIFKHAPLWIWLLLALVAAFGLVPSLEYLGQPAPEPRQAMMAAAGGFALICALYAAGRFQSGPLARRIAESLAKARAFHNEALERAQTSHTRQIAKIEEEFQARTTALNEEWENAIRDAETARTEWPPYLEDKWRRARAFNDDHLKEHRALLEETHREKMAALERETASRIKEAQGTGAARIAELRNKNEQAWQELRREWFARVEPLLHSVQAAREAAGQAFPDWNSPAWEEWSPPKDFTNAALFSQLRLEWQTYAGPLPRDPRLAFPGPTSAELPLCLAFPAEGSLLIESGPAGKEAAVAAINNAVFRLLTSSPVGKVSFTLLDPVGLGQNFAAITRLADYEENIIKGRIWTKPDQIEDRLTDLTEHMEKVIQMYLRNDYATITEYNQAAGNIAERYHFVVMADFPANLSDAAARRLARIASSGARCGVYMLIHWDQRQAAVPEFLMQELRANCIHIKHNGQQFALEHPSGRPALVIPGTPPPAELGNLLLTRIGEASRGSNRVEVPFSQVTPDETEVWSLNTAEELRVPIGRSGANKLQYLSMGRGTRQHALLAGKTGSGKSTLFHVIITNLALWCSPREVEFYLIDFKKGVEFKSYASHRLPHARVVAIESDREFGLSVLQRLDDELRRRGELFRKLSVQDLAGFRNAAPDVPMPRTLLIIDEFQEFFVEDDRIAQSAAMLLDRIVRQGRAFGIHVLLGSQTLGGAYTLARATIGQMVIRIALQSNEADAYLIMDENNPAPRLLSRPGEGIYNDMAGAVEGNSPFQAVWISEAERDEALKKIQARTQAGDVRQPSPVVFEGNAPADVRENSLLQGLLAREAIDPTAEPRIWLGAPNSIKGPTEVVLRPRSGANLLFVGQREEAILSLFSISIIALAGQFPRESARFYVFDSTLPGSSERAFMEQTLRAVPHPVRTGNADLESAIDELSAELARRSSGADPAAPRCFLLLQGMQNFKKLRPEDEFSFAISNDETPNAAAQMSKLITEGPSHGIHVIASFDTYNNVNRFLGRKGLSEFEMRVLFQMSPSDSASLCDDPKAGNLGLHRALLYNQQEGFLETFRPYSQPSTEWLEEAAAKLLRLSTSA